MVLYDLIRPGNEEKLKILLRILQETGSLDRLSEVADHAHRTAVISAVRELVQSQESKPHTCTHICLPGEHFEYTL